MLLTPQEALQSISKQMPTFNVMTQSGIPNATLIICTVMIQMASVAEHRKVSWVVVCVVMIEMGKCEDDPLTR